MQKTIMAVAIALGMASTTVTANSGVTFGGDFTYDFSMVLGEENGSASRALLNLGAEFDLSSIIGDGASFNLGAAFQRGDGLSELEDAQGFDNIDADNFDDLYEIVLQFTLNEGGIIKLGQQDANTDFAAPEYAGEFINSSMGFSPTVALPTYPEPVLAVSFIQKFSNSLTLSFGLFDSANSEDSFDDNARIGITHMSTKTNISLGESLNIIQASRLYDRLTISLEKSSSIELKADAVQIANSRYRWPEAYPCRTNFYYGWSVL